MVTLRKIKRSLEKLGYRAYISKIDGIEYLRGFHNQSLDVEILVKIVNNQYVFIDIINQKSIEKEFVDAKELIDYIKNKFSI